ncbi:MAG: S8 family serine peptidase, partial [Pyrinomonadaceae bacterium]|nr:S8 family serine peptidase [Pyrinomonadaceae bacterium]
MIRRILFLPALILLMLVVTQPALAQNHVVRLRRGEKGRVNNNITNRCSAPRTFVAIEPSETKWLKLIGEPAAATIAPGASKNFAFELDSADLDVGTYFVEVHINCSDCATQPGCGPSKIIITIQLTVVWSNAELESLQEDEYVARQVIVTLNTESSKEIGEIVQALEKKYQLKLLKVIKLSSISRVMCLFAILNPTNTVALIIRSLEQEASKEALIDSIQPNFIYTASTAQSLNYEDLQYGPNLIKAHLVWKHSTGKGIRIALVDTGIDDKHKDLKGRVSDRENFTDEAYKQDRHGTIMAGIIAAIHNDVGINGIAPNAQIISIKVLKQWPGLAGPTGTSDVVAQGVDFAIKKRVNIINMSFGIVRRDPRVSSLVQAAVRQGVVVVAAAGNSGPQGRPAYPAALGEVIAV